MSEVKALFRIGKTQWRKWNDEQRAAYNHVRSQGFSHETGVVEANSVGEKPKKDIFDVLEDVVEVVEAVAPVIAVAKTVAKATKGKKKAQ
jgi:hypothetical protein